MTCKSILLHHLRETLASRGDDGTVRLWGISGQLSQSVKLQTPLKIISNLTNLYPSANVAFRYVQNFLKSEIFVYILKLLDSNLMQYMSMQFDITQMDTH